MKKKIIKYSFVLLFLLNCQQQEEIVITDEIIKISQDISNVIDAFYIDNLRLPKSISEAKKYYSKKLDSKLFDELYKNENIKYIPLNSDILKGEYYLIYTNQSKDGIKKDLTKVISFCEYEKGKEGDILLNYNSGYNILKNSVTLDFEESQIPHWRNKILYNITFKVDTSNITFAKKNLEFKANIDTIAIEGVFFSDKSRGNIVNQIKKGDTLELHGFKLNNNSSSIKLIGVTVNNNLKETLPGRYYDEDGKIKILPHMRGCD